MLEWYVHTLSQAKFLPLVHLRVYICYVYTCAFYSRVLLRRGFALQCFHSEIFYVCILDRH